MKFKDYYEVLGVPRDATQATIKSGYRKLARKYHPDVSKLPDAKAMFQELGEAYATLKDREKRDAYDRMGDPSKGGEFRAPPTGEAGFDYGGRDFGAGDGIDQSEFFETLFGHRSGGGSRSPADMRGQDSHARVTLDIADAYHGARRSISLRMPARDGQGHVSMQERTLDVNIPAGIRAGQHLRLAGQGAPGVGSGRAGDLYLEIEFNPHPLFRTNGRDVYLDLPLAPWEAALGASVSALTPDGPVQLTIPPNSAGGRQLRLKGRGIPGKMPGDLYAVLKLVLPPADDERARNAYRTMAKTFDFNPRIHEKD